MPRAGITKQDVFAAANQLLGQGKDPTIEQIRQILKTGSNSTIAGHLRDWRTSQSESQTLAINEGLPHEMVGMMKGLWERLNTQAELKTDEVEDHYQVIINELQQELIKYRNNNRRWQKLFNQWQQEKARLLTDKLTLEQGFEVTLQEKTDLQQHAAIQAEKLLDKQARIEELQHLLAQAQSNLEHERTTARTQHLHDQQQLDQLKQEMQQKLNMLNDQCTQQSEQLQSTSQQLQLLQHSYGVLEKQCKQLSLTHDHQQQHITTLEKSQIEYQQASQQWETLYKQEKTELIAINARLIEQQIKVDLLTQQLADTKQTLSAMHDHNKMLTSEKWQLAQDKAHLEGQLKQVSILA